jgi:putative phosphoesterase
MLIGIISDTHDNVPNILKAKDIFLKKKVDLVLHAGDVVAGKTVEFFEGLKVWFIDGNCNTEPEKMKEKAEQIGGKYLGNFAEFELEGKKFCMYHGTDKKKLDDIIKSQNYDYVITGHTHKPFDKKEGKTRIINPGAHYYMSSNTIVLLDIKKDSVEFIEVK